MNKSETKKSLQLGLSLYKKTLKEIKKQYEDINLSTYDSTEFDVINGLFLRNLRFYRSFLTSPSFWTIDLAEIISRLMVESYIYLSYMNKESDSDVYLSFKKHGIGQEKLYKSKLAKYIDENKIDSSEELIQFINSNSDNEIWDETVDIKLKNWGNIYELAKETGLQLEYDLLFDKNSPTVHGHYNALRRHYLKPCRHSLHRNHLIPDWDGPAITIDSVLSGIEIFHLTYKAWITHWKFKDKIKVHIDSYYENLMKLFEIEDN